MSQEILGFLGLLVSILGWGSYYVPMKKFGQYEPFCFQAFMCTGIFISTLVVNVFFGSFRITILGFISGGLWALSNVLAIVAVERAGLARSASVWMGCSAITSFLWGLIYFQEQLTSILLGTLGLTFLVVGISSISLIGARHIQFYYRGVVVAVLVGLIAGTYLVPFKLSGLQPMEFMFPMSVGIFIAGWIFFFIKHSRVNLKVIPFALSSGVIWNVANTGSFFAIQYLGISIGFSLSETALLVSVLWGILYFKEIIERRNIAKIIVSASVLLLGAALLALAK